MATNNYMPEGRNPRNPAGQNAGYKKGGTTKIAGVMKSGGAKYQYKGTVTKGKVASTAAKSGASAAKKALEARIASMSEADKAKGAKVAGQAAAKRVYDVSGADINPTIFSIQEKVKPYMNMPTTKSEMNAAGKKASDRIMNMKKEKAGGATKYQSKGAVTAIKAGASAVAKAASKATPRPKMVKRIAKMR
jgi:hypothetical protein